jgi:hypothetical protein
MFMTSVKIVRFAEKPETFRAAAGSGWPPSISIEPLTPDAIYVRLVTPDENDRCMPEVT